MNETEDCKQNINSPMFLVLLKADISLSQLQPNHLELTDTPRGKKDENVWQRDEPSRLSPRMSFHVGGKFDLYLV